MFWTTSGEEGTHNHAHAYGLDDHEPDPLSWRRVGVVEGEESHTNNHEHPSDHVNGHVAARLLHDRARENREGWRDEGEREELDARADGRVALAALEEHWEIICGER